MITKLQVQIQGFICLIAKYYDQAAICIQEGKGILAIAAQLQNLGTWQYEVAHVLF